MHKYRERQEVGSDCTSIAGGTEPKVIGRGSPPWMAVVDNVWNKLSRRLQLDVEIKLRYVYYFLI